MCSEVEKRSFRHSLRFPFQIISVSTEKNRLWRPTNLNFVVIFWSENETIQSRGKDLIMISFYFCLLVLFFFFFLFGCREKWKRTKRNFALKFFCRFGFLRNEKAPKLRHCIRFSFVETFFTRTQILVSFFIFHLFLFLGSQTVNCFIWGIDFHGFLSSKSESPLVLLQHKSENKNSKNNNNKQILQSLACLRFWF